MLKRIPKMLLLVTLLTALVASSAPVLRGSKTCRCYRSGDRQPLPQVGCHFDQRTSQCVKTSCPGTCY